MRIKSLSYKIAGVLCSSALLWGTLSEIPVFANSVEGSSERSDTYVSPGSYDSDTGGLAPEESTQGSGEVSSESGVLNYSDAAANSTRDNPVINPEQDDNGNVSLVQFVFSAEPDFGQDAFVQIENEDTRNVYEIVAVSDDDFTAQGYVPEGEYSIIDYGIVGDAGDVFHVTAPEATNFTVNSSQSYTIRLHLSTEWESDSGESSAESSAKTSTEENTETENENSVRNVGKVPDILPWREVSARKGQKDDISFDGQVAGAYDVQIRISHTGAIGIGKFKFSVDGGKSWSQEVDITDSFELRIADSNGNPVSTGITINFKEGVNYQIDAVYSFSTLKEWKVTHNGTGTGIFYFGGMPESNVSPIIKIVEPGMPGTATYEVSFNQGKSWSDEAVLPSGGNLDLGVKSLTVRFTDGQYEQGDIYTADVTGTAPANHTLTIILVIAAVMTAVVGVFVFYLLSRRAKRSDYDIVR